MNSVPKLFSCSYADCWTEKHFSTEFGVLTPIYIHSHTLFWGCVSRWFGRALAWHARGQRFDPAILHQKSTVLRWKYGAFPFLYTKIAGNRFVAARMECNVLLFSESERFAQFNNSFQIGSRCHAALARAAVQNHDFHFQYSLFRLCYDARQIAICCAIIPHRKS